MIDLEEIKAIMDLRLPKHGFKDATCQVDGDGNLVVTATSAIDGKNYNAAVERVDVDNIGMIITAFSRTTAKLVQGENVMDAELDEFTELGAKFDNLIADGHLESKDLDRYIELLNKGDKK